MGAELSDGYLSNFCCNLDLYIPNAHPETKNVREITKRDGSLVLDARNIAYMKLAILSNYKPELQKTHNYKDQKANKISNFVLILGCGHQ